MIMTVLALLMAASLILPTSFIPPKGWIGRTPPADAPLDYIWFSPHFGVNGNGENLGVLSYPVSATTTLDAEVRSAIADVSQDRDIIDSRAQPMCHGLQKGWTFDARLPLLNGKVVSQVYYLTIVDGLLFSFDFTHLAGDQIEPEIQDSIQTICPSKPATEANL